MKQLITILLIAGACWGLWSLRSFYLEKQAADPKGMDYGNNTEEVPKINPRNLQGLHYTLETPLENALKAGPEGLKKFLDTYRPAIRDPRLAWIELDYVSLLALKDPALARAAFAEVKKRTPTNSPVYPRIEKLAKVYQ